MGSATDELRIAVIFRSDLDMPRGKSEVQFGHAVALLLGECDRELAWLYMSGSQLKLSMEVDGEAGLLEIIGKAEKRGVPWAKVTDAGRTVFGVPTFTCVGIGPMNKTDCNALTRNARMRV